MAKGDAIWHNVDLNDLCAETRGEYEAYKAAYKAMKDAREAFERGMQRDCGAPATGKRYVFGYNYGKLSMAIVDDDKPQSAPKAKATVSLADFLRAQQASGRAA